MTFLDTSDLKTEEISLRLERTCPGDPVRKWVPAYYFDILDAGGQKVGACDLRIGHTEGLYYGGNVGYAVDEPFRGFHYAEKACRLLFALARRHGMTYLLITCHPSNLPSRRTCERLGGRLLEIAELPADSDLRLQDGHTHECIYRFELQEEKNVDCPIIPLAERPELFEKAAAWFSDKWKVPIRAYLDSMADSLKTETGVPAWYVMLEGEKIIAGLGVIANDFHKRPDLTPNLCALFVDEAWRHCGRARALLDHACDELAKRGIGTAYLITTHTELYERLGWEFYAMVEENDGSQVRMYRRPTDHAF